ncbi:MAG TPA: hypothetical protein VIY48_04405 [Candidatus Paceibacterota bacterium]
MNENSIANLKPFQKGQSGNPGGKPVAARNRLQGDFMRTLAEDFAEYGHSAIVEMRLNSPAQYVKAIASLMPKELEITRPLDDISDDELNAAITAVRAVIAAQTAGERAPDETEPQSADSV